MSTSEIFISYAWGGDSEEMVNKLYPILIEKKFQVIRDKVDLGYKGNIKEFMEKIGKGKAIVVVISDKYLKSENCMFEMLEIHGNKNTWNRIFPVVLADAKIYDEIERIDYLNYWDIKIEELKLKIKTIINPVGTGAVIAKINQYNDIRRIIDEIMDMLRNMNTLTPTMHEKAGFDSIIKGLQQLVESEGESPAKEQKNRIVASLDDLKDMRKKSIYNRLERLYKLLDNYESQLMLESDPKRQMSIENEITSLNAQIEKTENEYKN